jgi:hypothetical protein
LPITRSFSAPLTCYPPRLDTRREPRNFPLNADS